MPNRIIKESIQTSDTLASVSADAERLFWRLVTAADDYGRFHARPHIVLGKCLAAFVGRANAVQVSGWLDELAGTGLIYRYHTDGQYCLCLATWDKHQRPPRAKASKFPPPPADTAACCQMPADDGICGQVRTDAPVSGIRDSGFANRDSGVVRHPSSSDGGCAEQQQSDAVPNEMLENWIQWYERTFTVLPSQRYLHPVNDMVAKGMEHAVVIDAIKRGLDAKKDDPLSWAHRILGNYMAYGVHTLAQVLEHERRSREPPKKPRDPNTPASGGFYYAIPPEDVAADLADAEEDA